MLHYEKVGLGRSMDFFFLFSLTERTSAAESVVRVGGFYVICVLHLHDGGRPRSVLSYAAIIDII